MGSWLLLLVPPLALNAASAALRGSLMGRSGEVEWEAALACLVVLVELALGLWLVSRGHGPLWCRAALAAVGLWFALAAGFVHSMAVYDVWL